jgi:hypothetical protein
MKRAMFSVLTLIVVAGLTGCAAHRGHRAARGDGCATCPGASATNCQDGQACGDPGNDGSCARKHLCGLFGGLCKPCCKPCCGRCRGKGEQEAAEAGPPAGAVTYPYYTTRGPRDFYAKNPGSIGP